MREEARVRASAFDPKKVDQEHSIVTRSMAKLRKAKPDEQGMVRLAQSGLIDVEIAPDSIDRIELSLNRIVTAAQVQGFELSGKAERAAFTDGSVIVPFNLKEAVKRSQHEPTPEELAKEEKERKRRERRWVMSDNQVGRYRQPRWPVAPGGGRA